MGAITLGIILRCISKSPISMGVTHVIDRVTHCQGRLPLKEAVLQFFSAIICILTGQSSGREGPAIHLGAATSSQFAQHLQLPSNSIRILAGCGTASAIAASFNTPIAGVIFAMEVVLMEYTVVGFIPIILAASSGTLISHWVYGDMPAFIIPALETHHISEVPIYVMIGLLAGSLSAAFCFLSKQCLRISHYSIITRFALAGGLTALLGLFVPEILGIGYYNVDNALNHNLSLQILLAILFAKLAASCVSQGLGMPIGIIGPALIAGACLGSATLLSIHSVFGLIVPRDPMYPMIAMGTMMAAVLNAPLAALTALIELTGTTAVVFPAMIGIVIANLTCTQIFKQKPPHITRLTHQGKGDNVSVFELALQRIGVSSLMSTNVLLINETLSADSLSNIRHKQPRWLIVSQQKQMPFMISGLDFFNAVDNLDSDQNELSVLSLPIEHHPATEIDFQLSAYEAYEHMQEEIVDQLVVKGAFNNNAEPLFGVISRQDLDYYFHQPRNF